MNACAPLRLGRRRAAPRCRPCEGATARGVTVAAMVLISLLDGVTVDLGVVLVARLPLLRDRGDRLAISESRRDDLRPCRLGAEGEGRTPAWPDVVGCRVDDVLERV